MNTFAVKMLLALGFAVFGLVSVLSAAPVQVEVSVTIVRIPADSPFSKPDKFRNWLNPNSRLAAVQTPQQVTALRKQLTETDKALITYTNSFVTVAGRQIETAPDAASPEDKRRSKAMGLWFTPSVEGDSLRLGAGFHGTEVGKLSPLISQGNSAVFVTQATNQVPSIRYVVILTPAILPP